MPNIRTKTQRCSRQFIFQISDFKQDTYSPFIQSWRHVKSWMVWINFFFNNERIYCFISWAYNLQSKRGIEIVKLPYFNLAHMTIHMAKRICSDKRRNGFPCVAGLLIEHFWTGRWRREKKVHLQATCSGTVFTSATNSSVTVPLGIPRL